MNCRKGWGCTCYRLCVGLTLAVLSLEEFHVLPSAKIQVSAIILSRSAWWAEAVKSHTPAHSGIIFSINWSCLGWRACGGSAKDSAIWRSNDSRTMNGSISWGSKMLSGPVHSKAETLHNFRREAGHKNAERQQPNPHTTASDKTHLFWCFPLSCRNTVDSCILFYAMIP